MKTCIYMYFGSLTLVVLTTPVVIGIARRIKALDCPGVRTVHTKPVPRIGGVAIFISVMCLIVLFLFIDNRMVEAFGRVPLQFITLLATATFVFLVGLIDDLRAVPATRKLFAEIVAAGLLCHMGIKISALQITEAYRFQLGWVSCPLTILWIVGITNAVNLSDGLDGLATGVSAVACAAVAIFAVSSQNLPMAVFMLALMGGLTGFLFFNFNPAKIFMGDCGSLFVGFMIASGSVMCLVKSCALVGLTLPILALGIPILDTCFAMLRRFLERRSLFAPDRSHFHHRLIDLGLEQRHAVTTIYAVTCAATGLGLFMMVRRDAGSLLVFGCLLFLLALLFRLIGEVRLRATLVALWQKSRQARREKQERRTFEELQLRFRRTRDQAEWWQAICDASSGLGFAQVSLTARDDNGGLDTRIWRAKDTGPTAADVVTISLPVKTADAGISLEFEIAIAADGSLETAARRGTLFSRLIDEYAVVAEMVTRDHFRPLTAFRSLPRTHRPKPQTAIHFDSVTQA